MVGFKEELLIPAGAITEGFLQEDKFQMDPK